MLQITDLCKNFGSLEVLKNLDLEVRDRSIFGLVGVNGAGKSTLLRCISGVYRPDAGKVLLDGMDTYAKAMSRRQIAYVSDDLYFPLASTIGSQKKFYQDVYNFDEEAFEKYLKLFGLTEKMSMANLSKGNKRRAALVFALSIHPQLILLDEAYDGLEPLARHHFKNVLAELLEDLHVSVIISSHNLKELQDICDSFGILNNGRITSYGDLLESIEDMNRYQAVFKEPKTSEDFAGFDVFHYEQDGKVIQMVIRGNVQDIKARLEAMQPLFLDVMPCNFEELFIYQVERKKEIGHDQ